MKFKNFSIKRYVLFEDDKDDTYRCDENEQLEKLYSMSWEYEDYGVLDEETKKRIKQSLNSTCLKR